MELILRKTASKVEVAHLSSEWGLCGYTIFPLLRKSQIGEIYKGRVHKILRGIQAAFVSLRPEVFGFLHVKNLSKAYDLEGNLKDISEVLKEGDQILVQVVKDVVKNKSVKLTTFVTLSGRFLVKNSFRLHKNTSQEGVKRSGSSNVQASLSIKDSVEKTELMNRVARLFPEEKLILRTACKEGVTDDKLKSDFECIDRSWQKMKESFLQSKAPCLLVSAPSFAYKLARDVITDEIFRVVVSADEDYRLLVSECESLCPENIKKIIRKEPSYKGKNPFGDFPAIQKGLKSALGSKVFLPSGGTLIIDEMEGLTVIDVNSSRATAGGRNVIFNVNKDAAFEIFRQITVRNIGGIIKIDFIDMTDEFQKEELVNLFQEFSKKDSQRVRIIGISELFVFELTRKRLGPSLKEQLKAPCYLCSGEGFAMSADYVWNSIIDDFYIRMQSSPALNSYLLELRPDVYYWFEKNRALQNSLPSELKVEVIKSNYENTKNKGYLINAQR